MKMLGRFWKAARCLRPGLGGVVIIALSSTAAAVASAQSVDTQPPIVTSTSPAAAATGVSVAVTIRATFDEPVQASSISMELRDSSNNIVPGIASYDLATRTVSFDPIQHLEGARTYLASVAGAADDAGNAMLAAVQWTFTTATPGFQESTVFSGLTSLRRCSFRPTAESSLLRKSGLIKIFDDFSDTTPTVFADLRTNVPNFWDRGLLGLALHPNFPATPYVFVLYTYDAPIGGVAPTWGDNLSHASGADDKRLRRQRSPVQAHGERKHDDGHRTGLGVRLVSAVSQPFDRRTCVRAGWGTVRHWRRRCELQFFRLWAGWESGR